MRTAAALLATLLAGCVTAPPIERAGPSVVTLSHVRHFSGNSPGDHAPDGWRPWTLSRFKKPTQYQLVDYDGRTVVKASAKASASGLVHPLDLDPGRYPLLTWRWKVTELIASADNTKKHAEDSPVRLVVSFAGDLDRLPLDDRMFFDNVRLMTGQQLPYATLMYIWENRAPKGTVIPNLHTSRIKMIVAESGRDRLGAWQEVTRNVYEDYERAFGAAPGRITAVAIMTDTDNTGENAHAYYGDIAFRTDERRQASRCETAVWVSIADTMTARRPDACPHPRSLSRCAAHSSLTPSPSLEGRGGRTALPRSFGWRGERTARARKLRSRVKRSPSPFGRRVGMRKSDHFVRPL